MAAWLTVAIASWSSEVQAACMAGQYASGPGTLATATVACSGSCSCPSAAAAGSGSITDGSGSYSNGEDCSWVISNVGSSISISFSQFATESCCDLVVIYSCSSSSQCSELASLSGSSISSSSFWTSTTGYMRVRFTSDSSATYAGFVGNWVSVAACTACPAGRPFPPPPPRPTAPQKGAMG